MSLNERDIAKLLETQSHILEELETLRYGDLKDSPFSAVAADQVVDVIGSWKFIIFQSILLIIWMIINIAWRSGRWDPYPFILLNLMLSFQAAFASPLILMAGNRSAEKDRKRAIDAYRSIAHIETMLDSLATQVNGQENIDELP